jgi:hypothetical protein
MPKMYQDGCEAITVQESQIQNAEQRGWSLAKQAKTKKVKLNGVKENGKS